MAKHARRVVAALFWIALAVSLLGWGGLVLDPEIGPTVLRALSKEGMLAAAYAWAGSGLVGLLGLDSIAISFAEGRFGGLYDEIRANPAAAMDILSRGMSTLTAACHYGAPVLALLWALMWWRRPPEIKTFAARR